MTTALRVRFATAFGLILLSTTVSLAQQMNPGLFSGLRWRLIGPFRSGRVSAVEGVPGDPNTFYIGTPGGGVWKTTDAGRVWKPIFDDVHVASIGAVAVSRSNPNVVYVGTGEETAGNGVYKSSDAGATWTQAGLQETHVIGAVAIDPANPDIVLVAAMGDRLPGPARGVFRTTDGGRTWTKVLYKDETLGAPALAMEPGNPRSVYAVLAPPRGMPAKDPIPSQIYKSTDEGVTWTPLAGQGLPTSAMGRIAVACAGPSGRVFAIDRDGLFRSDDGGATWQRSTTDPRIVAGGVVGDPSNADVIYVTQTSLYRSADGGRTFTAIAGAPSGDDYRLLWVDARDGRRLLAGVDQGAQISVNGGETWGDWYNQPTGQLYHVSTDNAFPYRVYAAQQDSGTVAIPSRSDFGEISFRDWYSIGGFEFGFIVPNPSDPDTVFSAGWYHTTIRYDRRTQQIAHVFVPGTKYRTANMPPLAFSPHDPHTLYLGTQFVMQTTDQGMHWTAISPDLTAVPGADPKAPIPDTVALTTLSPSRAQRGVIWVGTSNGRMQMTSDEGATWRDVTSPDLPANSNISVIEAGRHDANAAYAAVIARDDLRPYLYRTRDQGRTWQKIVEGLDPTAFVRVVREDPVRKGLLFAGTEAQVYVSFDDGDHWQSLQLNLPTSSMRDLDVHGDDLVVATYGRSIWILDNVTPLREADGGVAASDAHFFKPPVAVRVRWDMNQDTPLPVEMPVGQNPPDGAIFDYFLKTAASKSVALTIADAQGRVVRSYSTEAPPRSTLLPNVPEYWFAPPSVLDTTPGMHRFVWNLRYPNPKVLPFSYYGNILDYVEYTLADHAVPGQTPRDQPEGPLVVPGEYTVTLAAGGARLTQPLAVRPDPRVRATQADLAAQLALAVRITDGLAASYDGYYQVDALRTELAARLKALDPKRAADATKAVQALDGKTKGIKDGTAAAPGFGIANRDLARYLAMVESGDSKPADALQTTIDGTCDALAAAIAAWRDVNGPAVAAANALLAKQKLATLPVAAAVPSRGCGAP